MKNIMVSYVIISCEAKTTLSGQNMDIYFIPKYITHHIYILRHVHYLFFNCRKRLLNCLSITK